MLSPKELVGLSKRLVGDEVLGGFYTRFCGKNYFDTVPILDNKQKERFSINSPLHIGGKGFSYKESLNSCAGETLERISLMRKIDQKRYKKQTFDILRFFPLEEVERFKLNRHLHLRRINAETLTARKRNIPLEFIFPNCQDKLLPRCTSSVGGAFSYNRQSSKISGLLECVERHTLLKCWYIQSKLPRLGNIPEPIKDLLKILQSEFNVTIELFYAPCDIPCCVICARTTKGKMEVFGSSAELNLALCCKKAISESLQLYISSRFVNKTPQSYLEKKFVNLLDNPIDLFETKVSVTGKNFKLNQFLEWFKGKRAYLVDITPKQFKKYGFVYKSFCPELCQFIPENGILFSQNYQFKGRGDLNPFV